MADFFNSTFKTHNSKFDCYILESLSSCVLEFLNFNLRKSAQSAVTSDSALDKNGYRLDNFVAVSETFGYTKTPIIRIPSQKTKICYEKIKIAFLLCQVICVNPRNPWLLFLQNEPNLKSTQIAISDFSLKTKDYGLRTKDCCHQKQTQTNPIS